MTHPTERRIVIGKAKDAQRIKTRIVTEDRARSSR
jgi:hypothetical protein